MIQVLRLLRRPTHTPSRAGLVQYASYTTKCPGTTSGLSGKQATHDGVQALPPVGTGPAHKGCLPDQRNGVTRSGDNPATQQVSRNCHPPNQLRNKASRYWGKKNTVTKEHSHYHEQMQDCLEGSKPCHIRFRLVTAISFIANCCTSGPYQRTKRRSVPPANLRPGLLRSMLHLELFVRSA